MTSTRKLSADVTSRPLMLITTSYPESGDGSEAAGAFVAELADELAELRAVCVLAPGRRAGEDVASGRVRVRRFASPGKPLSLLSPLRPTDWPKILGTLLSLRREALRLALDANVDHVVALWVLPSGWAAREVSRAMGVPYSVWALGSDIWSLGRIPLVRALLARVSREAAERWADGVALGVDAQKLTGVAFPFLPSTRADYAPFGTELASTVGRRLLFLGRWHPNKGVDLLIEALERLTEDDWSLIDEVAIAGGGPLEGDVRAGVARLRAAGRPVSLHGFLAVEQARSALARADLLMIPSRIESIPLVFSDGVRAGCAIVAAPVGDLPTLVGETPPCGVVAGSVGGVAFAAAIAQALRIPPSHFRAGITRRAAEFSLTRIARVLAVLPGPAS